LATLHSFEAYLFTELPGRISRGVESPGLERDITEICHREIKAVSAEFMSTLQFVSPNTNGNRTVEVAPMVERQPGSGELLFPEDTGSSPCSSSPPSSTPPVHLTSTPFGMDSDSAQASSGSDHWRMCSDSRYCNVIQLGPLAHISPWTPSASGTGRDLDVEMMTTSESKVESGSS